MLWAGLHLREPPLPVPSFLQNPFLIFENEDFDMYAGASIYHLVYSIYFIQSGVLDMYM